MELSRQQKNYGCSRCQQGFSSKFCPDCGKPKELPKINGRYILSEIGSVLNFERGILYTIREVLLQPGVSVRTFIREDRNRLVKPILFLILCSLAYTVLQQWLNFEDGYLDSSLEGDSTTLIIFRWISENYGYSNILMAILIALWVRIFFRKSNYNFFEILILLCFLMGMGMLMFALLGVLNKILPISLLGGGFFLALFYISWGIGQFFPGKWWINFLKAFFSYFLGMLTFSLMALVIGMVIDWVKT